MKDLEFNCTQKCAKYEDGWDHPESILEACDENGNIDSCAECDCACNQCEPEDCTDCSCGHCICSIYEKTCTTEESKGPCNINDETGWHKRCTTTTKIIKKYEKSS